MAGASVCSPPGVGVPRSVGPHTSWTVIRPSPTATLVKTTPKMNPPTCAKDATPPPPVFEGWTSA